MYDLIIIGAGPAGITAAVYAARKRMELLVISRDIGGQAALSGDVENYTGYQFITGPELAMKFEEHLRKYNISLKENETVTEVKRSGNHILVETDKSAYQAKAVIIASGKKTRELKVPGEKEFKNRGLTYCATCDGPLFSNKDVAVIGGGNSALDAALQLIKIARHVYLINITAQLDGDQVMRESLKKSDKVTIFNHAQITAVMGDKFVSAIKINRQGKEENVFVQGVFVEIGLIPNSEFALEVEKNSLGEIKVNCHNETSIPGVFAAGDVTDVPEKQIIIAAGEGAKATLSVFRYLVQHKF
jgi:alkyl hydroperoxide reductase subunit F